MRYIPPANPFDVPPIDQPELLALKAMAKGVASGFQQQLALKVIVQRFSGTYDMSFRPGGHDGDRLTTFAEGKRFVGARILEAIDRPIPIQKGASDGGQPDSREADGRRNAKPRSSEKPGKPGEGPIPFE